MDNSFVIPEEGFGGQSKEQIEAALAAQAGPKVVENTPSAGLLAGKYKSTEDLVKGYKSAESELGRMRAELATLKVTTPAPAAPAPPAAAAPAGEPEAAPVPLAPVGDTLEIAEPPVAPAAVDPATTVVDFDVYAQEFADNGVLSDATYASLATQGISKKMTDLYIAGIQATKVNALAAADRIAGGPEARTQVLAWAAVNLTPAERTAFNTAVAGDDNAARELVFRGLVSRWKDSGGGVEPTLIQAAGRSPSAVGVAFTSFKDLSAAMRDPRYTTDPVYRQTVEARAAISPL